MTETDPLHHQHAVIITAWNRRDFVREAIDSVSQSIGAPDELAIVANYRDDRLESRVRDVGGRWITSDIDRLGDMVCKGLAATTAPVVSLLNDDDVYLADRLKLARSSFGADPNLGFLHVGSVPFIRNERAPISGAPGPQRSIVLSGSARTLADFRSAWSLGAAYNDSSVSIRRDFIAAHAAEFATIRLAVTPYLFYRAWESDWNLRIESAVLVGVGQHPDSITGGSSPDRSVRFARLRGISGSLAADAISIRSFLSAETWDYALREMIAMHSVFRSIDDQTMPRRIVGGAMIDLVQRRRVWVPRNALIGLAACRMVSTQFARLAYRFMTAPPSISRSMGTRELESEGRDRRT